MGRPFGASSQPRPQLECNASPPPPCARLAVLKRAGFLALVKCYLFVLCLSYSGCGIHWVFHHTTDLGSSADRPDTHDRHHPRLPPRE